MGKTTDKLKKAADRIKSIKHIEIIIAVLAIIVMLVIYFCTSTSCSQSEKTGIQTGGGEYDYYTSVVNELERKLSQIEGVGEVSVLVNWAENAESSDKDEIVRSKPEGVIIICEGGNNISVKLKLISSVASYFGISENKINVLAKTINSK